MIASSTIKPQVKPTIHYSSPQVPNLYYFIMPREIYLKAQARLEALKYHGVLDAQYFGCPKKSRALHKEPASVHTVWAAAYNIAARKGFVPEQSNMHT
jgi:hypothetical protein